MIERTFGWIQDPGDIKKLRTVVEIFDNQSHFHLLLKTKHIPKLVLEKDGKTNFINELNKKNISLKYKDLVGTSFNPRASARCNGIIQAAIKGQKRLFISDWPADNFLRWSVSLGFVEWEAEKDEFTITSLGLRLTRSKKGSDDEYKIYEEAFLSYPPISRIINLIVEASSNNQSLTKFEIGRKLGFIGEDGFTSISQNLFVKEFLIASPNERKKIRSNWEGDSDKYARMICSWLTQLKYPWIKKTKKKIEINFGNSKKNLQIQAYHITSRGFEIRKKILGVSKYKKITKIVYLGMLSTKAIDKKYLRIRRAYLISFLKEKISIDKIQEKLKQKGFHETESIIKDDLGGLINIGLSIKKHDNKYYCLDKIVNLKIPKLKTNETYKSDLLTLMEDCKSKISFIPHDYVVLIPMSFEKKYNRIFEIKTIELLTEHCKFSGLHLGGANKPDGVIYTKDYGVIIDTKSYKDFYKISISERDKMKRYIEENKNRNKKHNKTIWWKAFPIKLNYFLFLFISGDFKGNFKNQLEILSDQTNTLGSALSSFVLLNLADDLVGDKINHTDFKNKISCLNKVTYTKQS